MSHLSHDTPAELRFAELRFLAFTPRDASSWLPFRRAAHTLGSSEQGAARILLLGDDGQR